MRWLVEVSSIGKTDKESFCVEADSWQKALQQTRGMRHDNGPMSGFSIELVEDGCRAIDPMARLRYDVSKAPADMPLTSATSASGNNNSTAPAAASPSATKGVPTRTVMFGSTGSAVEQAVAEAKAKAQSQPPPSIETTKPQPKPPETKEPAPKPAPAPVASKPAPAPKAASPEKQKAAATSTTQVISKREQDATDATPLTYREYAFAVAPGTDEAGAEKILRTEFARVRGELERFPQGKLVNLAAFDVVFTGRPASPPIATLRWKDWRGDPEVAYPRRAKSAAPAPPVAKPAPAVERVGGAPTPPPAAAPVPAPAFPAPAPAPAKVDVEEPTVRAEVSGDLAKGPVEKKPQPAPEGFDRTIPQRPPRISNATPGRGVRVPGVRLKSDELIADLFEAMHDLHFVRDAVEGGDFCLALALEKMPSQVGIVHLYDIDKREFLVTSTRGSGAEGLLLRRHLESDPLLSAAMRKRRPVVIADASSSNDTASLERFEKIGGAKSVLCAPVMQAGRFLGAIELVNPTDGQPFTDNEGNALAYIGEQFAEFVATRGVITDPERISMAPSARR